MKYFRDEEGVCARGSHEVENMSGLLVSLAFSILLVLLLALPGADLRTRITAIHEKSGQTLKS